MGQIWLLRPAVLFVSAKPLNNPDFMQPISATVPYGFQNSVMTG